jgi:hypothetical protein
MKAETLWSKTDYMLLLLAAWKWQESESWIKSLNMR